MCSGRPGMSVLGVEISHVFSGLMLVLQRFLFCVSPSLASRRPRITSRPSAVAAIASRHHAICGREVVSRSTVRVQMFLGAMVVCLGVCLSIFAAHVLTAYNHKILTSARNGELIMWDLNQSGNSKYGVYRSVSVFCATHYHWGDRMQDEEPCSLNS